MSDERDDSARPAPTAVPDVPAAKGTPAGPQPEEIRFFGTTWLDHDGGYAMRRVGVAIGSLTAAVAGAFVLRFAWEGLELGNVGGFVNWTVVIMFAVCSAIAYGKTWESFTRRPAPGSQDASLKGLKAIGFIGSLIAYFLRSLGEAPGEKLHRAEYERAVAEFERRRASRTGNPAARRPKRRK